MNKDILNSSFRDPSGYVFQKEGEIFRKINPVYKETYDILMSCGLYRELVEKDLLVPHIELENDILKPEMTFISYPYEWSFSQYKDCALTTLEIQRISLKYGMTLKDASAYNIQFLKGKPLLIDTLSFDKYEDGLPWVAYKQFCQHFLAPLALMSYKDLRLSALMKNHIDGIPLDLTRSLLPFSSKFRFGILSHIHIHAKAQIKYKSAQIANKKSGLRISKFQLEALIDSLRNCVKSLKPKAQKTEWEHYYTFTNYDDEAFQQKMRIVNDTLDMVKPELVWDLGGNTGIFSRIPSERGIRTISFDIDPLAVEKSYLEAKANKEKDMLPLIMDLTNPSPAIGWANNERDSLADRAQNVDLILALALIHHLAISNCVPFDRIAHFFSGMSRHLLIEFVEKQDSQVQQLLMSRKDVFGNYDIESFECCFEKYFTPKTKKKIKGTHRIMYLMESRHG